MKTSKDFAYEFQKTLFERYILRYVKSTKDSGEITPIHIEDNIWNKSFSSQFIIGIVYDKELEEWCFIQKRLGETETEKRYWVMSYSLDIMLDVAIYFEELKKRK